MNTQRILRRAFELTRDYRALWLFGFLLALTAMKGGGGNGGGNSGGSGGANLAAPAGFASQYSLSAFDPNPGDIGLFIVALVSFVIITVIIFSIVRAVATTSLIRMVDRNEQEGYRAGIREGFRMGWSRTSWRIFWMDFLIGISFLLFIVLFATIGLSPLWLWASQNEGLGIFGTLVSVGLLLPMIGVLVAIAIAVVILQEFFHRACAIEDLGIFASIRRGWQVVCQKPGEALLLGVILFGISLAAALVLIPLLFVLALSGLLLAGLPGVLVGLFTSLFSTGAAPWIAGLAIAFPLFLLIIVVPMTFASGIVEVFSSSSWTLAYREMIGLTPVQIEPAQ